MSLSTADHPRQSPYGDYVYPVLSRRSGGLSLGINLNPDKRCNFDCVYCQVDRSETKAEVREGATPPRPTPERILEEVDRFLSAPNPFTGHPLKDLAIAGDGEPTQISFLGELIVGLLQLLEKHELDQVKLILFTNGIGLKRESLIEPLRKMTQAGGEIWCKLDFWDEASLKRINRSKAEYERLLDSILQAGKKVPLILQSCFFQDDHWQEDPQWTKGYATTVNRLLAEGVKIKKIQAYTLARSPAEDWCHPYSDQRMDEIAQEIQSQLNRDDIEIEVYYQS